MVALQADDEVADDEQQATPVAAAQQRHRVAAAGGPGAWQSMRTRRSSKRPEVPAEAEAAAERCDIGVVARSGV